MLVAERYEKIVQIVDERGSIRVSELSDICGVTEETIRRDLDRLENSGKLKRSHGGAVSINEHKQETPYFTREVQNIEEKKRIAEKAIQLVNENERILLDASSTAWYMAAQIPNIPLTVLTNSIKVAYELSSKNNIQVVSTGGILSPRSLSYVGPLAERSLEYYHVDKAFISCGGANIQRGISDPNELQARLKQKMIELSDEVIVMIDHSKFGVQSFAHITSWIDIEHLITDEIIDKTTMDFFKKNKVNVFSIPKIAP